MTRVTVIMQKVQSEILLNAVVCESKFGTQNSPQASQLLNNYFTVGNSQKNFIWLSIKYCG